MLSKMKEYARRLAHHDKYFLKPARLARQHGRDLRTIIDRTKAIRANDILAFTTVRNEMLRIPYFLDYYRKLGVAHFLFVDNDSNDGLIEHLRGEPDCSVWHTKASYKGSLFGVHWLNYLSHRYGVGHWCLTIDPDEFLVYPHSEDRNLHELVEFLELDGNTDHLFCLMLDMYGPGRISDTICRVGQNPLEVAPYFDATGYVQRGDASYGETYIQGGPRRRVVFHDLPEKAPALNKTPLVKWGKNCNYLSSTHMAAPKRLNRPHNPNHLSPTGCLLHFKFLSVMTEKAVEEIERKEHYDNSIEYRR